MHGGGRITSPATQEAGVEGNQGPGRYQNRTQVCPLPSLKPPRPPRPFQGGGFPGPQLSCAGVFDPPLTAPPPLPPTGWGCPESPREVIKYSGGDAAGPGPRLSSEGQGWARQGVSSPAPRGLQLLGGLVPQDLAGYPPLSQDSFPQTSLSPPLPSELPIFTANRKTEGPTPKSMAKGPGQGGRAATGPGWPRSTLSVPETPGGAPGWRACSSLV